MPARTFEIRLNGLVPTDYLLAQVRNVDVAEQELRTVLSGTFVDQAELHGFLHRLEALGLEVVEVRSVSAAAGDDPLAPEDARERNAGRAPGGPPAVLAQVTGAYPTAARRLGAGGRCRAVRVAAEGRKYRLDLVVLDVQPLRAH